MVVKRQKNNLASRLGDSVRKTFEEKKSLSPEFDTQAGLPAGIEGGIAKLVDCKFLQVAAGKQNAGKDMFFAAGIVVSPSEYDGVGLVGLRTQISEPLYDTPTRSRKTVDEHLEWVMNQLKMLGIDMSEMAIEDLEDIADALKEQRPYFRFRTWAGTKQEIENRGGKFFVGTKGPYATEAAAKAANPFAGTEPRVQHNWNGACEYIEDETENSIVDETPITLPLKKSKKTKGVVVEEEPEVEESDLSGLAIAADDGDDEAASQLAELAKKAGIDEDTINSLEDWTSVVGLIQESEEAEEESEEESEEEEPETEEEDWQPEKGQVYPYKAPGKRKAVDCEVTAVFTTKETVNLKNLDDDKIYRGVSWDKLEG